MRQQMKVPVWAVALLPSFTASISVFQLLGLGVIIVFPYLLSLRHCISAVFLLLCSAILVSNTIQSLPFLSSYSSAGTGIGS